MVAHVVGGPRVWFFNPQNIYALESGVVGWLVFILAVLGLIVYAIHRLRLRSVRQHNHALQAQVDARTRELRASHEKYRRLVENLQDEYIFYTHDLDGRFTYLSPSVETVLGYTPENTLGTDYRSYLADDPLNAGMAERLERIISGEILPSNDFAFLHQDGSLHILEVVSMPVRSDDGSIASIEGIAHDVTERRRAEEEIRRLNERLEERVTERTAELEAAYQRLQVSEARYRTFVQASYVGIWRAEYREPVSIDGSLDEQYRHVLQQAYIAECNDAFAKMYGYDRAEEVVGYPLKQLFNLEVDGYIADFQAFIEGGYQVYGSEISNIDRYGVAHDLLYSTFSTIEDRHLIGSWGIQIDITERKAAEAALQRNQRMLEKAQELAHFGSFEWDIAANHVTWSDELYRIYGATPDTFDGTLEAFLSYVHPDDRDTIAETVQSTLGFGASYQIEERIVRRDGETRVLATIGEVIRDDAGKPLKVVGSCQDITEQKAAEEALRESEARYRALSEERKAQNAELQQVIAKREHAEQALRASEEKFAKAFFASPDSISLTRLPDGVIVDVNQGFENMSGYLAEEVVGKTWGELETWVDAQVRQQVREAVAQGSSLRHFPATFRRKDGEMRHCLVSAELVEIGGAYYGLGVVHDVTERKEAEQALRESEAQYKALYEEVEGARKRLEHLSRRLVRVQEQERRRIALELHDEVGQLLTILKLALETVNPASPESVEQKLADAKGLIDTLAAEVRKLSLNLRPSMLDDLGLWPTLEWYVERYMAQTAIQVHLEQENMVRKRFSEEVETTAFRIIQEALTNVARYADVDRAQVLIRVKDDHVCIDIRDQGKGFALENALRDYETGGLSGMRERARLVGGTVSIASQPAKGTHISARLPL